MVDQFHVTPAGDMRLTAARPDLIGHLYDYNGAHALMLEHDARIKELERRGA